MAFVVVVAGDRVVDVFVVVVVAFVDVVIQEVAMCVVDSGCFSVAWWLIVVSIPVHCGSGRCCDIGWCVDDVMFGVRR